MYDLPESVEAELKQFAQMCGVERLTLFGSRARGDNKERSDVDLAVNGGHFYAFRTLVKETIWSLLCFDIVNLDEGVSEALQREIDRDGVVIYEKS